jgi:hypothetical protein
MLTPGDKDVLAAIVEQSCKTRGKNAGQRVKAVCGDSYYSRCLNKLARLGLIEFVVETSIGTGWDATAAGWDTYKKG